MASFPSSRRVFAQAGDGTFGILARNLEPPRQLQKLPKKAWREIMKKIGDEVHLETNEARAGETPHIVRYVLAVSLFLAIAALSIIWITGALSQREAQAPVRADEHAMGG